MLPAGMIEASYTQWEYLFARHFKRRLYLYLANNDWMPDENADADKRQGDFIQYLKEQGVHRTPFSTVDQLARAVLKEEFSAKPIAAPQPTAKPIVLPYPSLGPLFKGREGFMLQLHESLQRGQQTAITSKALYGLGGIGKTRAAVEYAWAHKEDYSALLFVLADSPEALRLNLGTLSVTLAPDLATTEDPVRLATVLYWLGAHPNWLLIADNVDRKDTLAELERILTEFGNGSVIITSRLSDFSANVDPLPLDVLPLTAAAAFLLARTEGRRRITNEDAVAARQVAIELGQLALALEQAGAYIAKHRLTFGTYLQRWQSTQRDEVLSWFDQTITGYHRAVAVTWQTSVAQLSEGGRRLLERLAWLAPERVPEFLLDLPIPKTEDLHAALIDLASYSLVTLDTHIPFFFVHRLVQDATRRALKGETRHLRLVEALNWIDAAFPYGADEAQWSRAQSLAPHAKTVAEHAGYAGIGEPTARLQQELIRYFLSRAKSSAVMDRAVNIFEEIAEREEKGLETDELEHFPVTLNRL
jgi:hypothetical protein